MFDVFGFDFERKGIVANVTSATFTLKNDDHSELLLTLDATAKNIELFIKNTSDIILTERVTNLAPRAGFIVARSKFTDSSRKSIEVFMLSLSWLLHRRLILGVQKRSGNVENVIRYFISNNAIEPVDVNRRIDNLILGDVVGVPQITSEAFSNEYLDESIWEICSKYNYSYDLLLDIVNKKIVFVLKTGTDLTDEQSERDPVIFSKAHGNVTSQDYVEERTDYKNTAYITGDDGLVQNVVNGERTGLDRIEVFFAESELVGDDEISTSDIINSRAKGRLNTDYRHVKSFQSEVLSTGQFEYKKDYFVGDRVMIRNDDVEIVTRTYISKVTESITKSGITLSIEFGSSVPTPFEKIKKRVK